MHVSEFIKRWNALPDHIKSSMMIDIFGDYNNYDHEEFLISLLEEYEKED